MKCQKGFLTRSDHFARLLQKNVTQVVLFKIFFKFLQDDLLYRCGYRRQCDRCACEESGDRLVRVGRDRHGHFGESLQRGESVVQHNLCRQ